MFLGRDSYGSELGATARLSLSSTYSHPLLRTYHPVSLES